MTLSDRRLKRNIVLVSRANGINLYEFEYLKDPHAVTDSDPAGVARYRGVMADEVEAIPGVVTTDVNGFKHVDYSKLGFDLVKVGYVAATTLTGTELTTAKDPKYNAIDLAVGTVLFFLDKRLRVVEAQPSRTVADFKVYVKSLL